MININVNKSISLSSFATAKKILPIIFSFFIFSSLGCASRNHNSKTSINSSSEQKTGPIAQGQFLNRCGSKMNQTQYEELLSLTDLATFNDFKLAAPRAKRIAEIFYEASDRRGIFASMYVAITVEGVASVGRNAYQDNVKASQLVKRFADRYFAPLHSYLLNGSTDDPKLPVTPEWAEYYRLASDCNASDLRILGSGVNTHLTYDLPYTLKEIQAPESFYDDFILFGNIVVLKKRESTNLLKQQQNVYAASFFDLLFVGKIVDSVFPDGTASLIGFQYVRAGAWAHGVGLQKNYLQDVAPKLIQSSWNIRQGILALMPKSNESMKGTEE